MLDRIRTVLIHNSHPGNIGASARALKNMGLQSLYLIAPKKFPAIEAIYMASRAEDIVERAIVLNKTEEALSDCTLILASSSRSRARQWPEITPKVAAEKIIKEVQHQGMVAILYGCEQHGLSNEELELAHYQIVIPAVPHYASLNVSQAVQLISYEIYVEYLKLLELLEMNENGERVDPNKIPEAKEGRYATFAEMQGFYAHLEETLIKIHFTEPSRVSHILSRLRRLFSAARPDIVEINILRGILRNIITSMDKVESHPPLEEVDEVIASL